jgi:hypothetical protein
MESFRISDWLTVSKSVNSYLVKSLVAVRPFLSHEVDGTIICLIDAPSLDILIQSEYGLFLFLNRCFSHFVQMYQMNFVITEHHNYMFLLTTDNKKNDLVIILKMVTLCI